MPPICPAPHPSALVDIERLLRDAGLGKWEAMAIVSRAKAIFDGRDALDDGVAKAEAMILERLKKISA